MLLYFLVIIYEILITYVTPEVSLDLRGYIIPDTTRAI